MGMTGMFKWLRKDTLQRGRSRQSLPPNLTSFNNDAYRNALQEFLARRKNPDDPGYIVSPNSTATSGYEFFVRNDCDTDSSSLTINQSIKEKVDNCYISIPGIPHAQPTELFEIGWIRGTEHRYIEVIYAEWQNTKVSLRRNVHQDCLGAVDRDIIILSQIRHQNIMLLMGTTQTVDNHLVSICEPVDCTLYHFVHQRNEKLSIQGVAKNSGGLASALQYAHMRGYIHSAINPHCVFLTLSGVVKLGGWELAIESNKTFAEEKNYEDCLRSETFQWQAPEVFSGQKPTVATDIFGLALLTWESCTGIVPWADLSKEEVEKQYLQLKKGISTESYNFPGLLNTFLESGLQLDASERSMDLMIIARYFQRLELQYENTELSYIDQQSMNGTDTHNNSRLSINSAPLISPGNLTQLLGSNDKFPSKENIPTSTIKRIPSEKKKIEPRKLFPRTHLMNRSLDINHMRNIGRIRETSNNNRNEKLNQVLIHQSSPKEHEETRNSESHLESSMTQESTSESRVDMKNLKETLANRRRSFFGGNNTTLHSSFDDDRLNRSSLLEDIKSKDYKPHKPASHKTSIEPKSSSSSSKHYSTFVKSTQSKSLKLPYSYVPGAVRDAIIQPQVLNTNSQSFFETSLWRKERSMCLSNSQINGSMLSGNKSSISPDSDQTYTIKSPMERVRQENLNRTTGAELITDKAAMKNMARSTSLQALKDTLERVTNLVKLNNSNTTGKIDCPTSEINDSKKGHETDTSVSKTNESVFEELYNLNENIDDKIKTIERSSSQRYFTVNLKKTSESNDRKSPTEETKFPYISDSFTKTSILDRPRPTSVELKTALECGRPITRSTEQYNVIERRYKSKPINAPTNTPTKCIVNAGNDKKLDFLNANNKIDENKYSLYSEIILARRRSLPPSLSELNKASSDFLINQAKKDTDLNDSTVEDFYIDDDIDENGLAPNMILLDKDSTAGSHDIFPELTDNYFGTL